MEKENSVKNKLKKWCMGVVFSFICAFGVLFSLTGCNESTGAMWYSGTDVPTYTTYPAKVGDFYLDEDDFIVYKYTQNDGWQVIGSLKGQDGLTPTISINTEGYWVINGETTNVKAEGQDGSTPTVTINNDGYWVINGEVTDVKAQGEEGQKGEDGKDGTSFLSGEGVPASTLGNDGDVYLNITTSDLYKKAAGEWFKIGNIKGAQGDEGAQGPQGEQGVAGNDGSSFLVGTENPVNSNGNDGDVYLNSTTNDLFKKENGSWNLIGNIKGEQGEQGEQGVAGSYFYSGATDPATETGKNGDVYLNTTTNDLFQKIDGTWTKIGNFQGSEGESGADGITPHIGENGNWWVGDEDTGYAAVGKDGESSTISVDESTGHLIIDGEDTGYALGISSQDLYENLQGIIEYDGGETGFAVEYESVTGYEYLNQWEFTTSVFSGWAGVIGKPESISAIKFKVRARETPITGISVILSENGRDGSIIAQEILSVDVQPYEEKDIIWQLDKIVNNTNNINYYFGYACNAYVDKYGSVYSPSQQLPEEEISYSTMTLYAMNNDMHTDFSAWSDTQTGSGYAYAYIPVQVGSLTGMFKLSDNVVEDILSKMENELYKNSDIILPSTIYGYANQTMQIYFRNICAYPLEDIYIKVNSSKGKQYTDRWEYTPTGAENFDLTIEIYSKNWALIDSNTFSIDIKDSTTKTSATALVIGDSTVFANIETQKMLDLAETDTFDLTLLGTLGEGENKHEGRGGWTAADYVNDAANLEGDVTNPFYNTETQTFDFSYYMTQQSYESVDIVYLQLGINDIFSCSSTTLQDGIKTYIDNLQIMVNKIHEYSSDIKIVINLIIPCDTDQDSFTDTYDTAQTVWGFMRNMYKANQALLSTFAGQENIYLSWYNAALDSVKNQGGNVHPTTEGYNQLGTQMYYFMKAIL